MWDLGRSALETLGQTVLDVLPIVVIVFAFQAVVIRRSIPNLKRVLASVAYVVVGLAIFLEGLELALFPVGTLMAEQLTAAAIAGAGSEPAAAVLADAGGETAAAVLAGAGSEPAAAVLAGAGSEPAAAVNWSHYYWVYIFAAAIGFSTTIAEPALIAVSIKARDLSGGAIGLWSLRVAVAVGVAFGITLGVFRIVTGTPLHYYIIAGYIVVMIQTLLAPKSIVALAYDSGGVTTSTVTVPLVAALGLGLASTVPGRNPILDGFGLIAFASLFPIVAVLGYAQIAAWARRRSSTR